MNLADVFTVTFIILGLVAILVCYWLFAAGLFPAATERAAERLARGPVRFFLLGAVTFVPVFIIGLQLLQKGPNGVIKVAGMAVILLPLLAALFGSAGLPLLIGRGLHSAQDEQAPWRRQLRGGVVLAFCTMLPVLGWFLVLPYVLLTGFGLWVASGFRRQPRRSESVLPPPLPSAPEVAAQA